MEQYRVYFVGNQYNFVCLSENGGKKIMQNMTFQWDSRYVYYSSSSASCPSIISVRKYYQETDMRGNYLPLCHLHFSSICHFFPFQIRIYPVNFISSSPGSLFLVLHCLNFPEDSQSPPNIGVTRINRS